MNAKKKIFCYKITSNSTNYWISSNGRRRNLLLTSNTINEFSPSIPLFKFGRRQGEIAKIVTRFFCYNFIPFSLSLSLSLSHTHTHTFSFTLFLLLSSLEHTCFLYTHQETHSYFNRSFSILQLAISGKEASRETPFFFFFFFFFFTISSLCLS